MSFEDHEIAKSCPSADISAYIDGELAPSREMVLEGHFISCSVCLAELNRQKAFLLALDHALEKEDDLKLPANFTRVVVANAESRVAGLRRRSERYDAFFACAGLFLIIVFALGASGSRTAFDSILVIFEKVAAVITFAAHMVYDIAVAAVILLRSCVSRFVIDGSLKTVFPGLEAILDLAGRIFALIVK